MEVAVRRGSSAAASGKSHSWVTPIVWSPSPSANSISVEEGTRLAILIDPFQQEDGWQIRRFGSSPVRSKGFGRIWAEAALERGDKVAATARDASTLEPLTEKYGESVLTMALDVQDQDADFAAVAAAHEPSAGSTWSSTTPATGYFGDGRGGQRGGGPRPDRDQPLRRALGDPGGAADHARAGLRPHHPGVLDRRRHRVPGSRPLPRLEVGRSRGSASRSRWRSRASAST